MPEYTSIRVRKDTKELLEKALIELETRLRRRLDYDELLRILTRNAQAKPGLLRLLLEKSVKGYETDKAEQLLRSERKRGTRFETAAGRLRA